MDEWKIGLMNEWKIVLMNQWMIEYTKDNTYFVFSKDSSVTLYIID